MADPRELAQGFARAGVDLIGFLSDQLRTSSPELHAQLEQAVAGGIPVALSVVTMLNGRQRIDLDLIGPDGSRVTVASLNAAVARKH